MKSNFAQRIVTGAIFVAVLVGCILFSPISFGTLFLAISALSIFEFGQLVNRSEGVQMNKLISMLGGAYLFLAVMSYAIDASTIGIFVPYILLLLYLFISELYLKRENPILNWAHAMLSQLYIGLPFALLNVLAFQSNSPSGEVSFNPILPLSVFIFLWLSDSGAYCFGTLFGKHRLFERISPKKSWEGFIGGCLVAVGASLILSHFFPFLTVVQWVGLALVVVIFGTWGDLTESLLKRQLQIKDSGNILPGHGGLLDRFDSALLAIPASVAYLHLIQL